MAEDVEQVSGTTEEVTASEASVPDETLAPDNLEPVTSEDGASPEENKPEETPFNPEEEQVIEFGGKTYTLKGSELQSVLESHQALAEKEKSLHRDYTQKTQALSEQRKSIESAFGRMPESNELQSLGKLYQAYFKDPQVAEVVNAIIAGQPLDQVISQPTQGKGTQSPEVTALQQQIKRLEGQLSQFVSSTQQEKQSQAFSEGKRIFDSWVEGKSKEGITINEDIIESVIETAGVLLRRNPTWDQHKALNEAYRRETIDQVQQSTAKKVLVNASQAKKNRPIKITPKSSAKEPSSYAEIFQNAM